MRRFELHRDVDVNGISGTGVVVEGVVFTDGRCAYRWRTDHPTTTVADSLDDVMAVHGHGGATRLVWVDDGTRQGVDAAALALVLTDLDRCEHGRHEGDCCVSCPDGESDGNPLIRSDQRIGYGLDGAALVVMPETRAARKDRKSWYRRYQ